ELISERKRMRQNISRMLTKAVSDREYINEANRTKFYALREEYHKLEQVIEAWQNDNPNRREFDETNQRSEDYMGKLLQLNDLFGDGFVVHRPDDSNGAYENQEGIQNEEPTGSDHNKSGHTDDDQDARSIQEEVPGDGNSSRRHAVSPTRRVKANRKGKSVRFVERDESSDGAHCDELEDLNQEWAELPDSIKMALITMTKKSNIVSDSEDSYVSEDQVLSQDELEAKIKERARKREKKMLTYLRTMQNCEDPPRKRRTKRTLHLSESDSTDSEDDQA